MSIAQNTADIKSRIKTAAEKSGRKSEDITLIAVSKTMGVPEIFEAADAGLTDFGENKPQELRDKYPMVPGVNWHMIGHLQTNKVKYAAGKAVLIHSVDSERLLDEINRLAEKENIVQNVLIQLNIAKEQSKSGIYADRLDGILEHASNLHNIEVKGLMTIPPVLYNSDELRFLYEFCNKLFIDNKAKTYHNINMEYLSMGMTNDFEIAIEMGANMVRVGTGIFGKRDYTKK